MRIKILALYNLLMPLSLCQVVVHQMEHFLESMYRLDALGIPCGRLDSDCFHTPHNIALLVLCTRPDHNFLLNPSQLRIPDILQRIQMTGLHLMIYNRLALSQKILLSMLIRYAHILTISYNDYRENIFQFMHPLKLAKLMVQRIADFPVIPLGNLFTENFFEQERFLYLFDLPPEKIIPDVFYNLHREKGECELTLWSSVLIEEAADGIKKTLRSRLCGFSADLLDKLSGSPVWIFLQPFLSLYPKLAFANDYFGRVFSQALKYDEEGLVKWLASTPLVDVSTPPSDPRILFVSYIANLRNHGRFLEICLGDDPMVTMRGEYVQIVDKLHISSDSKNLCHFMVFGMSWHMEDKHELVSKLLGGVPFEGHEPSEYYTLNLVHIGLDKPSYILLDDRKDEWLRMNVYHRFGRNIEDHIAKPFDKLIRDVSVELTGINPLFNAKQSKSLMQHMISCNVRNYAELRSYLKNYYQGVSFMTCKTPFPMARPEKFQIEDGAIDNDSYIALFTVLTGIPIAKPLDKLNLSKISRILKKMGVFTALIDRKIDQDKLTAIAGAILICTHKKIKFTRLQPLHKMITLLGKYLCGDEKNVPEITSAISLPLTWHLLVGKKFKNCDDYRRLHALVTSSNRNEIIDALLNTPLYGKVLENILMDPVIANEFHALKSIGLGSEDGHRIIEFINSKYRALEDKASKLSILFDQKIDQQWISHISNPSLLFKECKSPSICLSTWTFFGHPIIGYQFEKIPIVLESRLQVDGKMALDNDRLMLTLTRFGSGRPLSDLAGSLIQQVIAEASKQKES